MKIAFVFFTLNAERNCDWEATLAAVEGQSLQPDLRLLVDSESNDKTVELARQRGWEIHVVKRKDFNHGKTRDMVIRYLDSQGYDIVVFASQDIIPAISDSVKNLIVFLNAHSASMVYGRQLSHLGVHSLSQWQRSQCYSPESCVKNKSDIPAHGLMTAFCSNAFSAWKIKDTLEYGGFPQTDFGEDTLAAAKIILAGGSIGYCAEASCFHDHSERWSTLFYRGFQIGRMHAQNPWLIENFGSLRQCGKHVPIPKHIILPLSIKYAGFLFGKIMTKWK